MKHPSHSNGPLAQAPHTPVVLIRPALREDEGLLTAIHLATWTTDVSPGGTPAAGFAFFAEATQPEDVLVAEEAGVVLGYVWLRRTGPRPAHDHVLVLDGLAVDPAWQGHGMGGPLCWRRSRRRADAEDGS